MNRLEASETDTDEHRAETVRRYVQADFRRSENNSGVIFLSAGCEEDLGGEAGGVCLLVG